MSNLSIAACVLFVVILDHDNTPTTSNAVYVYQLNPPHIMNNGHEGAPFLPLGAGFTVTQRSLNLSLLSSDLAVSDLDLSSLVLSLRYSFDTASYSLFPYLHRVERPYSPSVSSTSSFSYAPDMPKPERGTPEYAAYKQAKKDRKERRGRDKSSSKPAASSNSLAVERPPSRAGSEFSYLSSTGGGSEDESNARSMDRKGETKDRSIAGFPGIHGYGHTGGGYQTSYADNSGGDFGHAHSVSPLSSEGSPKPTQQYVAPQYSKLIRACDVYTHLFVQLLLH